MEDKDNLMLEILIKLLNNNNKIRLSFKHFKVMVIV